MSIRKILVPLSGRHDPADPQSLDAPALTAGFSLARKFAAEMEVLCVTQPPSTESTIWADWIPDYGIDELLGAIERQSGARHRQARASYDKALEASEDTQRRTSRFVEKVGEIGDTVGSFGRLSDLIVVASTEARWGAPFRPILEAALRRAARPVFVSSPKLTDAACRHVAIAWNDTAEAARAAFGALPFLKLAEQVDILCCEAGDDFLLEDSSIALLAYLKLHGVSAKAHHFSGSAWKEHDAIIAKAIDLKCDLLCLGSVIHARTHSLIYGSLTEAVLKSPRIPALLVP